jgi:dinuclear metal center YbgI/SA1388 family protein
VSIDIEQLVEYLDEYLSVDEIPDFPNALNGLQVAAPGPVSRVVAAVDATAASIRGTIEAEGDLLLVHHGLFWGGNRPVTGRRYRRLAALLEARIAVYASHLPLDVHPDVGNNAVLARELGIEVEGRFARHEGTDLGFWGRLPLRREALAARLDELLGGPVRLIAGGPEKVERVGVLTGGGGSFVAEALNAGLDALVTGEGSHHTYFDAQEGGLNLYYGGHYATETWGVKALAAHIADRFDLDWSFLDLPTGL